MGVDNKHEIHTVIDKLTLESLSLMEQHIRNKMELEHCMMDGESHLAKARYIMGHKQVSQLQLPNEDSNAFQARCVVNYEEANGDRIKDNFFDLEVKVGNCDKTEAINPIKWFGVLVPQSLYLAQDKFKLTLHWSIKCVNIQRKLYDCLNMIGKLNKLIEF